MFKRKGGRGGQRLFEQCSKKLHFSYGKASLREEMGQNKRQIICQNCESEMLCFFQVSYGEMIGCDNQDCPIEWFHFGCLDITTKPKGKWYCPKCRGDKVTVMKPGAVVRQGKGDEDG